MFLLLLSTATAVDTINNNIIIVIMYSPGSSIHEQFAFILLVYLGWYQQINYQGQWLISMKIIIISYVCKTVLPAVVW